MKTCLILGAGGFIGKELCKKLAKKYKILAYDRTHIADFDSFENIASFERDFQKDDFSEILNGVDIVVHLICTTIPKEETNHIETEIVENVIPTIRLLEAMKNKKTPEIVFASSAGTIYGESLISNKEESELNPICSYGVQKQVIENYITFYSRQYGINYKIARISNPYGLGQNNNKKQGLIPILIEKLLHGEDIAIFGDGENERDYIYISDMIEGLIKILDYYGKENVFNVAFGKSYTINEVVNTIESVTKLKFKEIHYLEHRSCDVVTNRIDINKSYKELKWKANIDLEAGIEEIFKKIMYD